MPLTFWNNLSTFEQFFYILAVPSTFILIIQIILTLLGFDSAEADAEEADTDAGGTDGRLPRVGFQPLSIRTVMAFFTLFGWTGIALCGTSLHPALVVVISGMAGLCGMLAAAGIIYGVARLLAEDDTNIKNAIGQSATVCLPIPQQRSGVGRIEVRGRLAELAAVTDDAESIPDGADVRITGIGDNAVIVTRQ